MYGVQDDSRRKEVKVGRDGLRRFVVHHSGEWISAQDRTGQVLLISLKDFSTLPVNDPRTLSCGFSRDGKFAAIEERSGKINLWETKPTRRIRELAISKHRYPILAVSDNAGICAIAYNTRGNDTLPLQVVSMARDGVKSKSLPQFHKSIIRACVSPDGRWVAIAGRTHSENHGEPTLKPSSFTAWHVQSGVRLPLGHIEPHIKDKNAQGYAYGIAFSPDSRFMATVGMGKQVHVWRIPIEKN